MTSDNLAKMVSCDPALLARLLRHLAANRLLEQTNVNSFKPTAFTQALLQPVYGEWITHLYDATIPCFFARTGYQAPSDPANGVFQYTKGWEGESFNHVMGGVMANQASWLDKFPYMTLLDSKSHLPLLVDVGDNVGHDMERFRESHPETAARARALYMHSMLHDWSDEPARKILAMQREALTPGYSTLLIHNHIVSEAPAHPHTHGIRSDDDGHGGRRGKDRGEVAAAVDLESVADRYVEQSGKQKLHSLLLGPPIMLYFVCKAFFSNIKKIMSTS
ncbi:hypothetical protein XPA_004413 [Xanthoria parietina]